MTPEHTTKGVAVLGGGCFWCTEAVFKMLQGVISVEPGYAGGDTENPTFSSVCTGNTGHAEVVRIEFEPSEIIFYDLLTVFFATHDATQVNRQGNDIGSEYRSIILYTNIAQKAVAEEFIKELNDSAEDGEPIVTEVKKLEKFYPAEQEHIDYYAKNQNRGYCQIVIAPKLQKVQQKFSALLKKKSAVEKPPPFSYCT